MILTLDLGSTTGWAIWSGQELVAHGKYVVARIDDDKYKSHFHPQSIQYLVNTIEEDYTCKITKIVYENALQVALYGPPAIRKQSTYSFITLQNQVIWMCAMYGLEYDSLTVAEIRKYLNIAAFKKEHKLTTKKAVKQKIDSEFPWVHESKQVVGDHTYDALAVGLVYLER